VYIHHCASGDGQQMPRCIATVHLSWGLQLQPWHSHVSNFNTPKCALIVHILAIRVLLSHYMLSCASTLIDISWHPGWWQQPGPLLAFYTYNWAWIVSVRLLIIYEMVSTASHLLLMALSVMPTTGLSPVVQEERQQSNATQYFQFTQNISWTWRDAHWWPAVTGIWLQWVICSSAAKLFEWQGWKDQTVCAPRHEELSHDIYH
jgi:hypothetical protein